MELEGIVHHGVIVVESPQPLPEGTRVKIVIAPAAVPEKEPTLAQRLLLHAGKVPGLPSDLAEQHEPSPRWLRARDAAANTWIPFGSARRRPNKKGRAFEDTRPERGLPERPDVTDVEEKQTASEPDDWLAFPSPY